MIGLTVLYEDAKFVVVDKPSGLAVHRGASADEDDIVTRLVRAKIVDLRPVHRLDRGTSGALVLARGPDAARELGRAFEEGAIEKTYVALVRGAVGTEEVLVDYAIPRDEGGARVAARTFVRGIATAELMDSPLRERRYSLVEARPVTGRFHQVRRHVKHLGHPVIGDANYGRSEHNRLLREKLGLSRLALHASRIRAKGLFDVGSPLPADMANPLSMLGLRTREG
ncbi:MAG: pseudouridylate synthase [Polyangiaceae bacterium]|nr:pseudouridylate synthase [Polyangiaceae bacterium]